MSYGDYESENKIVTEQCLWVNRWIKLFQAVAATQTNECLVQVVRQKWKYRPYFIALRFSPRIATMHSLPECDSQALSVSGAKTGGDTSAGKTRATGETVAVRETSWGRNVQSSSYPLTWPIDPLLVRWRQVVQFRAFWSAVGNRFRVGGCAVCHKHSTVRQNASIKTHGRAISITNARTRSDVNDVLFFKRMYIGLVLNIMSFISGTIFVVFV